MTTPEEHTMPDSHPASQKPIEERLKDHLDNLLVTIPDDIPQDPKKDAGDQKNPMHLIPYEASAVVARALKSGADKYGEFNWRENHVKMSTYIAAIRRHVGEWQEGRDADPETGEHPLAHVAASCLIILDAIKHGCVEDDRPKR